MRRGPGCLCRAGAGASLDFETLSRHCRAKLASFKTPNALYFREALPRNPSGKILKRLLRAAD
jgi:fatty-acyl-CoA synthase